MATTSTETSLSEHHYKARVYRLMCGSAEIGYIEVWAAWHRENQGVTQLRFFGNWWVPKLRNRILFGDRIRKGESCYEVGEHRLRRYASPDEAVLTGLRDLYVGTGIQVKGLFRSVPDMAGLFQRLLTPQQGHQFLYYVLDGLADTLAQASDETMHPHYYGMMDCSDEDGRFAYQAAERLIEVLSHGLSEAVGPDDVDSNCSSCGGSGGGRDAALRCLMCRGRG